MAHRGRARDHDDVQSSRVLIATDLTEHAEPALVRGRAHAEAIGADWVVCHVVPDVLRHHPLAPTPSENDLSLVSNLTKRAAELVTDQVGRVLRVSPDDYRVVIETGRAEDEIVRAAEAEGASLVVIGAKPRAGTERVLGHVAERVVRYSHTSVLVARPCIPTGMILVATDFTESSLPSVRFGAMLVAKANVDATLLHVMQRPSIELAQLAVAFGSPTMPPTKETIDQLAQLGLGTLDSLAKQHGFAHVEQVEGHPADVIVSYAAAMDAEMIVMGSRGRSGLARFVLGSTAEQVIRRSEISVLIAR